MISFLSSVLYGVALAILIGDNPYYMLWLILLAFWFNIHPYLQDLS